MHGQMMQGMCGMGPGGMVAMMLAGALLWLGLMALIVLALVIAIRWLRSPARPATGGSLPRALEVLRERYARGEIGHEEFERMRRELG